MNQKERFNAIMSYKPFDRVPLWHYGAWKETRQRWKDENGVDLADLPKVLGMDEDWHDGFEKTGPLVDPHPIGDRPRETLEETDEYIVVRNPDGGVDKWTKGHSSLPMHLEFPLKPTRQGWKDFKRFLVTDDPRRRPAGWEKQADAIAADGRDHIVCCGGGGLYGLPRYWLGDEQMSYLPHDDPALFEEIIEYATDHFIAMNEPIMRRLKSVDIVFLHEDCCFKNGPLVSPSLYEKFYDKHYRRMCAAYHAAGAKFIMLDSDGKIDVLAPLWLASGVDMLFPIEVGTWKSDPVDFRERFGKQCRMMGGVNKHVIAKGPAAIRKELKHLKPLVKAGGYIPMPDHRLPPNISLDNLRTYVEVFKEVFHSGK